MGCEVVCEEGVIRGFISLKKAEEEYEVILDPEILEIKWEETERLRKQKCKNI